MNNTKNIKKYCLVKINTIETDPYYSIKSNGNNLNKINLILYINKSHAISDLLFLASSIKQNIKMQQYYNVIFNFKNCSTKIKELKEFQQIIKDIFQLKKNNLNIMNSDNIHTLSTIIVSHILKCGKYPDFNNYKNPIIYNKIKNYINNVLNTNYNDDIIMEIIFNVNIIGI